MDTHTRSLDCRYVQQLSVEAQTPKEHSSAFAAATPAPYILSALPSWSLGVNSFSPRPGTPSVSLFEVEAIASARGLRCRFEETEFHEHDTQLSRKLVVPNIVGSWLLEEGESLTYTQGEKVERAWEVPNEDQEKEEKRVETPSRPKGCSEAPPCCRHSCGLSFTWHLYCICKERVVGLNILHPYLPTYVE